MVWNPGLGRARPAIGKIAQTTNLHPPLGGRPALLGTMFGGMTRPHKRGLPLDRKRRTVKSEGNGRSPQLRWLEPGPGCAPPSSSIIHLAGFKHDPVRAGHLVVHRDPLAGLVDRDPGVVLPLNGSLHHEFSFSVQNTLGTKVNGGINPNHTLLAGLHLESAHAPGIEPRKGPLGPTVVFPEEAIPGHGVFPWKKRPQAGPLLLQGPGILTVHRFPCQSHDLALGILHENRSLLEGRSHESLLEVVGSLAQSLPHHRRRRDLILLEELDESLTDSQGRLPTSSGFPDLPNPRSIGREAPIRRLVTAHAVLLILRASLRDEGRSLPLSKSLRGEQRNRHRSR